MMAAPKLSQNGRRPLKSFIFNMLARPMLTTSPPTFKRHSSLSMSANSKAMVSILEDKEAISRSSHDIDVDMCVWMKRGFDEDNGSQKNANLVSSD